MIYKLDDITIRKIAAGEVIENPSSIIKELIENSIDAKAKNIIIEIKKGGKEYIRVTDDGIGIKDNDIEDIFLRYATSKIQKFSDLNKLNTLGFRGEALYSILSVSDIKLYTKSECESIGNILTYKNSKLIYRKKISINTGTSFEITNLFSNTPVRKKFLDTDIKESNKITRLIRPTVHLSMLRRFCLSPPRSSWVH